MTDCLRVRLNGFFVADVTLYSCRGSSYLLNLLKTVVFVLSQTLFGWADYGLLVERSCSRDVGCLCAD